MGTEIPLLTSSSALGGTEVVHGVQSGNSRKITIDQIRTFVKESDINPSISIESVVTHTVTDADLSGNKILMMSNGSANSVSVPTGLTGVGPFTITQIGDGQTSLVAQSGVTIRSADNKLKLRVKYSSASLIRIGTNEYLLIGDIAS